ncbi:hypothetical protein [Pelagibacterium montanilacus]|uniref:hypothetical protein n=1 Tax=Pelagibacterium montanilacus TaxID=2185280 RepID=UPI000F8E5600|nr:hypothetical protein [Pelagibacterium montanilacus]
MFIRCAFFRGTVRPGCAQAFDEIVETTMVPLWRQFPRVRDVRVMRQVETDAQDHPLPLVLVMEFETREDIAAALASDARARSREASKGLLELFDGEVFHTVFSADRHQPS